MAENDCIDLILAYSYNFTSLAGFGQVVQVPSIEKIQSDALFHRNKHSKKSKSIFDRVRRTPR